MRVATSPSRPVALVTGASSKFALEAYSDALRNEVGRFGIRVIVIEPGGVATEYSAIATHESTRLSGTGPYGALAAAMERLHVQTGLPGPVVISDLIVRALRSKRPARATPVASGQGRCCS